MRHHPLYLKPLICLTLLLVGLTNWTSLLAQPLRPQAAINSVPNSSAPTAVASRQPEQATTAVKVSEADTARQKQAAAYARLPLSFEANRGQTDARVKFFARGRDYMLFLTATESVWVLNEPASAPAPALPAPPPPAAGRRAVLRMKLAGANPLAQVEGRDEQPGKNNYFFGRDASRWHTNVPNYSSVQYHSVYPGVDLLYYGSQRQIEYDFVVAAGADYRAIKLALEGAKQARVEADGDLVLTTAVGEVRHHKPFVYQEADGVKHAIDARYVLKGNHEVGFAVGQYDRSKPLVIDPVVDYATYLGGTNFDEGRSITLDASGNAYIAGRTFSFNFPVTIDAFDPTYANSTDVFVTKLNASGSNIIYSTYLGGNSDDSGYGLAIDASGNAYVTGSTTSNDYPTTPGAFQTTMTGSFSSDAFITKLNPTGTALVYSTYLGGTSNDQAASIALDTSSNAYVTGFTLSTTFPTTPGAFQTTNAGGSFPFGDAFITKLNPSGTALVYSTYLGGINSDQGTGIAVDASGQAFISGTTLSTDFDVTPGAFQTTYGGTSTFNNFGDAFVTKLNSSGTALVYSTYFGGSSDDGGLGIALNAAGEAFMCGVSNSFNLPVTPGVVRVTNGGVARSDNAAASWAAINTGLTDGTVLSFAVNPVTPATVYAGTNVSGVFKSTNSGANWSASNSGLTNLTIKALAIDPATPTIVYLGTSGRGVFKSTDAGATWRAINTGQGGSTVNALAIDPTNPAIVYAGTDVGAFKTTNSGANWSAINTGLNNQFIHTLAIDPAAPANVYAGTFSGVFITHNGGQNWAASGLAGGIIRTVKIDPLATATVYAGGDAGVLKSTDAGATWHSTNTGLTNRTINAIAINPTTSSIVYAGTGNGVFKSTNGGGIWSSTNTGLAGAVINTLTLDPLNPLTIYAGIAAGSSDGFITRLNATGTALVYSTYLGGSNLDNCASIAIDAANNAYVTGQTSSPNFPTTPGTFQTQSSSFDNDAFVTRLNPTGAALVYSTYLGGFNSDQGSGIAINAAGNAYVTGTTGSSNFPVTPGAYQPLLNSSSNDAFVAKIASTPSLTADLKLDMTGPSGTLMPGNFFSYNLTITNNGPDSAFSIMVTDELPPGLTFSFCNSNSGFCSGSGNSVTYNLNSLAANASATVSIFVNVTCTIADNATLTNMATVEALTPDPNPANNAAMVSNNSVNPQPMISPTNQNFGSGGGSSQVSVISSNSCAWSAVSNVSWINITSSTGCCNGTVNYTVAPNPGATRTGTLTIAGNTFTVVQGGPVISTTIGVYLPSNQTFYLRNSNTAGNADITIQYGPPGAVPVVGDFDGNGTVTIGVYDPPSRTFYLRNTNTPGNADITIQYGPPGAIPLIGDWNGDGIATIGVYDPPSQTFYLRNSNTVGNADLTIQYGPPGAVPVVGDWDNNGTTTIGVYDPPSRTFYLRNSNSLGNADLVIQYGPPNAVPVVGDFDGNGTVTIGVYEPTSRTFYLRNSNTGGFADLTIQYGPSGATPLAGNWDGL